MYVFRGNVWYQTEDYDHAISDYSQAIRLDSNLAVAYYNRAMALEAQTNFIQSLKDLEFFVRLSPADSDGAEGIERLTSKIKSLNVANEALRQEPGDELSYPRISFKCQWNRDSIQPFDGSTRWKCKRCRGAAVVEGFYKPQFCRELSQRDFKL